MKHSSKFYPYEKLRLKKNIFSDTKIKNPSFKKKMNLMKKKYREKKFSHVNCIYFHKFIHLIIEITNYYFQHKYNLTGC